MADVRLSFPRKIAIYLHSVVQVADPVRYSPIPLLCLLNELQFRTHQTKCHFKPAYQFSSLTIEMKQSYVQN